MSSGAEELKQNIAGSICVFFICQEKRLGESEKNFQGKGMCQDDNYGPVLRTSHCFILLLPASFHTSTLPSHHTSIHTSTTQSRHDHLPARMASARIASYPFRPSPLCVLYRPYLKAKAHSVRTRYAGNHIHHIYQAHHINFSPSLQLLGIFSERQGQPSHHLPPLMIPVPKISYHQHAEAKEL